MTFVRRAAYRVNNAVADIKRVQYRCQDTKVGLKSRDDRRVRLTLAQMLGQLGFGEGGITCFVDDGRRRAKRRQRGYQLQQPQIKALAGRQRAVG